MTKKHHLGIIGATGFTGRQTAKYLEKFAASEGIQWVLGGRTVQKLEDLRAEFAPSADIMRVDVNEAETTRAFAESCRVVLNLAGPYAEHGEKVMRACVEAKAHYLDLTGEIFWVREMIAKLGNQARENKVKVIPVCGYEALPFDLGVLGLAQKLREIAPGEKLRKVLVEAEFIIHDPRILLGFALSGGTTGTFKTYLKKGDFQDALDPAALLDDMGDAAAVRATNGLDFFNLPKSESGTALAPMFPAPFINPQIVHRTNAYLKASGDEHAYAEDFEYREGMNFERTVGLSPVAAGLARAVGLSFQASTLLAGDAMSGVRDVLKNALDLVGPGTGEGPPEDLLDKMDFRLNMRGEGENATKVRGEVYGKGHPGYLSTAHICAEAALALAIEGETGALGDNHGIVPPAAALGFGARVRERMERAGLTFKLNA